MQRGPVRRGFCRAHKEPDVLLRVDNSQIVDKAQGCVASVSPVGPALTIID